MTRNELKDIIKECLEEITIEESSYDSSCEVFIEEAILNEAKDPERKALVKKISKALKDFVASEGLPDVCFVCSKMFGNNKKFMKGESNTILFGIDSRSNLTSAVVGYSDTYSYNKSVKNVAKAIKENNQDCVNEIKEAIGRDVSVRVESGKLGAFNVAVTLK